MSKNPPICMSGWVEIHPYSCETLIDCLRLQRGTTPSMPTPFRPKNVHRWRKEIAAHGEYLTQRRVLEAFDQLAATEGTPS
jgi:hypothetical protein